MDLRKQISDGNFTDNSHMRPIKEHTFLERIHLTDEHIEDISSELTVVETDRKSLSGIKTGYAESSGATTIQTVTPVYGRDDESLLAICYKNCLNLAIDTSAKSIASPLSTGKNCFPKEKASGIAANAVLEWFTDNHCHKWKFGFLPMIKRYLTACLNI